MASATSGIACMRILSSCMCVILRIVCLTRTFARPAVGIAGAFAVWTSVARRKLRGFMLSFAFTHRTEFLPRAFARRTRYLLGNLRFLYRIRSITCLACTLFTVGIPRLFTCTVRFFFRFCSLFFLAALFHLIFKLLQALFIRRTSTAGSQKQYSSQQCRQISNLFHGQHLLR